MTPRRRTAWISIGIVLLLVGATAAAIAWALASPLQVQTFLVRLVVVSLILFLGLLYLRYFALLWFGYLQHTEQSLRGRPEAKDLPPVSIILPAYNEAKVIGEALESLVQMDYPSFEVIVVDDGSTDDTADVVRRWERRGGAMEVRLVSKRNGGKATALNTGISQARHPFVMCMDADSWMDSGTLRAAMPRFQDPTVGAVAGNVKIATGRGSSRGCRPSSTSRG